MDCNKKSYSAYLLNIIIEKLVTNTNNWNLLKNSEELQLLNQLDDEITKRGYCENLCKGCLDYYFYNKIILDFIDGIKSINHKYEQIISKILKDIFKLTKDDLLHPLDTLVNMISNQNYIIKFLETNDMSHYKVYCDKFEQLNNNMAVSYYNHKQVELYDEVLNNAPYDATNIRYSEVDFNDINHIFYIDQNFISKFNNDENLKKQINNIKIKENYKFVFSPYLIEDGIKMNKVFLKEYFEDISILTNNVQVIAIDNNLFYGIEEIENTVDRVILWDKATRAAEQLKVYIKYSNEYTYPLFNISKENKIYQKINNDIHSFFKNIFNEDKNIQSALSGYLLLKSSSFNLAQLQLGIIETTDKNDCINKIQELYQLLDLINFKVDKEEKKTKSGYQDTEHLKRAWLANYFITDDNNLIERGNFIYKLLNIKTELITSKEFKLLIRNHYKKDNKTQEDEQV